MIANLVALVTISLFFTLKRMPLAKVALSFYLMFYLLYFIDHLFGLDYSTWIAANLIIDTLVLCLCYTAFIRKSVIALFYGVWVLVAYVLPELLTLNGVSVTYNKSNLMPVIDILFVLGEFVREYYYTSNNMFRSADNANSSRRNPNGKE